jgi:3-dehydroquinate synthetase
LEAFAGYSDRLLHGEGVAIGMCLAFRLSEEMGLVAPGTAARVERHLAAVGLPTHIRDIPGERPETERLLALMAQDKKVRQGRLTFILARAIGEAFLTQDVDTERVRALLERQIAGRAA